MGAYSDGQLAQYRFASPRNALLLFAGAALSVGAATRSAVLLGAGTTVLLAFALSWFRAFRLLGGATAERAHHARAFEEQTLPIELTVRAGEGRVLDLVLLEDYCMPASTYRLRTLFTEEVGAGRATRARFDVAMTHRRGAYALGPTRLVAWDPFGFFERELLLENLTQLVLYPNSVELQEADLLGDGVLAHVGYETTRRTGMSEEFVGIRDYRPGDSTRAIHWRSSARHGRPMVKEFQEEITTRVSIFLDLGRRGLVGVGDQTSVEYGIKAAASIARRAVALGHRIEFFGVAKTVEHLPEGAGTEHLLALLDRLAFLKPEGESAFAEQVRRQAAHLPRGATAVLIASATATTLQEYESVLDLLVAQRVLPLMVLIDDRAFVKIYEEQERAHYSAPKLEELARALAARGAVVRVIRRAKTIGQALTQGLERDAASAL
ncbi:MAG: DUF58 domain-containing protein [Candidatus Sumerlaeia bacterium]|nr:DUF58 domain-containing protein [Candidatus Sumerlaeia bacterium]